MEEVKQFGYQWGEKLAKAQISSGDAHRTPHEIAQLIVSQFSGWGFEPRLASVSEQHIDIRLQNCVFREVVEFHPDLVCPLLHGVLEGMLSPLTGRQNTALENGIAHGKESCQVMVLLDPPH